MYIIDAIEQLSLVMVPTKETERQKAQAIVNQLNDSIAWLSLEVSKQKGYEQKSQLQKEITAATWERDRIIKELNKV